MEWNVNNGEGEGIDDELEEEDADDEVGEEDKARDLILLLKSNYKGRPETCFFPYPKCCGKVRDDSKVIDPVLAGKKVPLMYFRLPASKAYRSVKKIFEIGGFKCLKDDYDWNGYWGKLKPKLKDFILKGLNQYQKINHWPGCWKLGRKDNLYTHIVN